MSSDSVIGSLGPLRVLTSEAITDTVVEKRSWKDRLFSWPWRPWISHKSYRVPSDDVYIDHSNFTVYCHPAKYNEIKAALEEQEAQGEQ